MLKIMSIFLYYKEKDEEYLIFHFFCNHFYCHKEGY